MSHPILFSARIACLPLEWQSLCQLIETIQSLRKWLREKTDREEERQIACHRVDCCGGIRPTRLSTKWHRRLQRDGATERKKRIPHPSKCDGIRNDNRLRREGAVQACGKSTNL